MIRTAYWLSYTNKPRTQFVDFLTKSGISKILWKYALNQQFIEMKYPYSRFKINNMKLSKLFHRISIIHNSNQHLFSIILMTVSTCDMEKRNIPLFEWIWCNSTRKHYPNKYLCNEIYNKLCNIFIYFTPNLFIYSWINLLQ